MKKKYIAIIIFLGALLLLLTVMNFRFKEAPRDKALGRTPKEAETKYPPAQEANRGAELPPLAILWEKNLFTQARRTGDKTEGGGAPVRFNDLELVGICKFGDKAGAIIVNKGAASNMPPQVRSNIPGANSAQKANAQALNISSGNKPDKRFYQQGQRMANGFVLKEIQTESVVLARGSEEVVLKIQIGSKEGLKRMASFKPVEKGPPVKEELNKLPDVAPEAKRGQKEEKKLPKPPSPPTIISPGAGIKQA